MSGVLKGCLGSGSLITVALDPCLRRLSRIVCGPGLAWACADDIGFVLASLRLLRPIARAFCVIKALIGLIFKPRKCVIVPAAFLVTDAVKLAFRRWLERKIPQWKDFHVASSAKFLGAWIGPETSSLYWRAAADKFRRRTRLVIDSEALPSIAVRLYAASAIPVLGYLMQLRSLP